MEISDYTDLITSEYQDSTKFLETVRTLVSLPVRVQKLFEEMIPKFDVDLAVGQQLDTIGKWVGISRNVSIPIPNVFFSWDGSNAVGWDFGIWRSDNEPTTITVLPDEQYRTLIKAKIAANKWDGTTEGAYRVWEEVFTEFTILIQDHQDMSYSLAIIGGTVDSLTLALITGGYIPLKPEGVHVNEFFTPIDDSPFFAWDTDSEFLAGWDEGSWAVENSPT